MCPAPGEPGYGGQDLGDGGARRLDGTVSEGRMYEGLGRLGAQPFPGDDRLEFGVAAGAPWASASAGHSVQAANMVKRKIRFFMAAP